MRFAGAPLPLGVAHRQGEVEGVGAPFPARSARCCAVLYARKPAPFGAGPRSRLALVIAGILRFGGLPLLRLLSRTGLLAVAVALRRDLLDLADDYVPLSFRHSGKELLEASPKLLHVAHGVVGYLVW